VAFLCEPPPRDLAKTVVAPGGEKVHAGKREVYVYYPNGMGQSKLKLPLDGAAATIRNINTVSKLVALTERPNHNCALPCVGRPRYNPHPPQPRGDELFFSEKNYSALRDGDLN